MKVNPGAIALATALPVVQGKSPCTPAACCKALSKLELKGRILDPSMSLFDEVMGSYWSTSANLEPNCVALPASAEDVSKLMKVVSKQECHFGVRGGGHGAFKGSNSVDEGITIDFSWMNATSYDEESGLAKISPGAHWQDVYEALLPYNIAVAGGRAGTVGTAGFITGGGNSFHSASHGMACDTVANWDLVLADGTITNANATHNEDLFTALKGGSGNYGLIYNFDMYPIAFETDDATIWGGNLDFDLKDEGKVIEAYASFAENQHKDENTTSIIYWAYLPSLLGGDGYMLNAAIENTKAIVKPDAVKPFYDINPRSDGTKIADMATVTLELGAGQPSGFNNVWLTASFANDVDTMKYAVEQFYDLNKALEKISPSDESGLNLLCMFQPITKSIAAKGVAAGGNVMGLDGLTQDGNGVMFLLTWAVQGGEQADEWEEASRPILAKYMEDLEAFAEKRGVAWPWKFINYADASQNPLATVGDKALAKMKAASEKYDPQGVFQKLRSSGHKLPA